MTGTAAGLVAVEVDVEVPRTPEIPGDRDLLRRHAAELERAADDLRGSGYRVGATAAWVAESSWCGSASTAFVVSAHDLVIWLDTGALALTDAASTCATLAQDLAHAQDDVAELRHRAALLSADVAGARERSHRLALAMSAGCGASVLPGGQLVCDDPALRAQRDHLVADVGELRSRSQAVEQRVSAVTQSAAQAGVVAAAAFQRIAGSTLRARAERAARAAADQRQQGTWAANSSWPSQLKGFGAALVGDFVEPFRQLGPMPTIADPGPLLEQLSSTWTMLTHPSDTAGQVIDAPDLRDHAYGHWAGTVVPGVALTVLTDGASLESETTERAVEADVAGPASRSVAASVATGEAEALAVAEVLKDAEHSLAAEPRYAWGGLASHEDPAGKLGHTVAKHVQKSDAFLAQRLVTEVRLPAASTFADLATANRLVDEALTDGSPAIEKWLLGTDQGFAVHLASAATLGQVLLRGATVTVDAHRIKVVLRRDAGRPTGFRILTVKICP